MISPDTRSSFGKRATALVAFVCLDAALLGLTMCTRTPPWTDKPMRASVSASASASASALAPAPVTSALPLSSSGSAVVDAAAAAVEPLLGVPATAKRTCGDLDRAIDDMFALKRCSVDGDCVTRSKYCACGVVVSKTAVGRIDALTAEWNAKGCAASGPPRPCATCPMPPVPACVGGACAPRKI